METNGCVGQAKANQMQMRSVCVHFTLLSHGFRTFSLHFFASFRFVSPEKQRKMGQRKKKKRNE